RDDHRGTLDLVRRDHRGRPRRRGRVDEGQILLAARLNTGGHPRGEDPRDRRDAALEPLDLRHRYGYTGGAARPVRSSQPHSTFRSRTPLAEPPLPRLPIAEPQTARCVRGSPPTVSSPKPDPPPR